MSGTLSLNGTWGLTYTEGMPLVSPQYLTSAEPLPGRRQIPAQVPAPIHLVLQDAGLVEDLYYGLNTLRARWVEEQFWVYRHSFTAPAEAAEAHVWLTFQRLEYQTTVFLNGEEIGQHANAHRPARFDLTGKLRAGENTLVVKISTGMHELADKSATDYVVCEVDMLLKRHWQRKAQFQGSWDWAPRLTNVGILGDVALEWRDGPRLDEVTVLALPSEDLATAQVLARVTVEGLSEAPATGILRAKIMETGQEVSQEIELPLGRSRHEVAVELENPRLWWPLGHGEQCLYTVEVTLECAGETQSATRRTGVRRVEIDQSPHPVEGRYFILRVNNRPVFCKGANWVPADSLYSTVSAERYRALMELARAANFNMIRVWGGAIAADHAMLEACDELGLMVWHDLLFACAQYPGDDPDFREEVRVETTWVIRDVAHHPSLVVWCGNNEIEWGDWDWGYSHRAKANSHYPIFHHDLPKIAREENPSAAYWISSPSSPDYKPPNDPTVGDQHPWHVSMGPELGAAFWKYRGFVDRFPNEGGVMGASSPKTLRQFLPPEEQCVGSPSWDHHDNSFATRGATPGDLGFAYSNVREWTGLDPLTLDLDTYAFASGLVQAEGLQEYIGNYRRRMFSSAAAIFWSYNDCWPCTHGWTIVDYYLRRHVGYHPVRRAFQPVTVVVAAEGDMVRVFGVNDTPAAWSGEVRYGLFALAGGLPRDETQAAGLPANASTLLGEFPRAEWEALGLTQAGAFAVLTQGGKPYAQHRLFLERFCDLEFAPPEISLAVEGERLTLSAPMFVWGVCLDPDGEAPLADDCFDLLPGIPYEMPWSAELGEAEVKMVGSREAVVRR